jgi:hypothetical protein
VSNKDRGRFDRYSRRRPHLLPLEYGDESCPPGESCPICDALGIHVTGAGIVHAVEAEREETPATNGGPSAISPSAVEGSP